MTRTVSTEKAVCADCGSEVEGRFCSNCGAELARQRKQPVRRIASDIARFPITLLRMLVAPVKTTLALCQDPAYRGHVSFLAISVALSAVIGGSAVSGALQQTSTEVAKVPELAGNAVLRWWLDFLAAYRKELLTLATYAVIAIHLIVNGLVLKALRPRNRITLGRYFKLFCIASGVYLGVWTLAESFNVLVFGQDPSAFSTALISSGAWPAMREYFSSPSGILVAVTALALLVYHVRVQAAFWGLSALRVVFSVPLVLVASAILVAAIELALFAAVGFRPA